MDIPDIFESALYGLGPRRRKVLETQLVAEAVVAAINFILAYRSHSIEKAIVGGVIWLIIAPVFSLWWVRNMESD
jgi:hypothetical protein